ncbi:protease complex subunit PrcB family protein [Paenibacillus hodogayensis]|uniref:Protease complex subunit PrcB family protein n=1 Tax=Paenibacillus hodogayensis TaxID=279208 RepID=A0ABV5VQD8_9BACL
MKQKLTWTATAALALTTILGGSAYAFSDIKGDPNETQIISLQQAGIISGVTAEQFAPKGKVTMAQSVAMLVKAFDLNINHISFIKQPKASDYFTGIADDAWYATPFLYAQLNGLPLPKDVDPTANVTKEQFADLLFHALTAKGDYAFVKMFVELKDEKDVTQAYMSSIQNLVLGKMVELDNGYFHPKQELTRGEAASMLQAAIDFANTHKPVPPVPQEQANVTLSVTRVTDDVNKVTLTWSDRPNPGYGITVSSIEFMDNGNAVITYAIHEPDPDKMYPQVISEAKVDTYVSSAYKPVLNSPQ